MRPSFEILSFAVLNFKWWVVAWNFIFFSDIIRGKGEAR